MACLRKAIELDGCYAIAHRELGWLLCRTGDLTRAKAEVLRAIELDGDDGWAHIYLGNVLWRERDLSAAEESFEKAIEAWPNSTVPYWNLAMFY